MNVNNHVFCALPQGTNCMEEQVDTAFANAKWVLIYILSQSISAPG